MGKAGGALTCMHEAAIPVILLFGLSDGYPKPSINLWLSASPSSLAGGTAQFGGSMAGWEVPAWPILLSPCLSSWLSSPFGI